MATPPPGWYPDPSGNGSLRWWDGQQWADPAPYGGTAAALRAPEGTATNTAAIWLIIFLPLLSALPMFFIDWSPLISVDAEDPLAATRATLAFYASLPFVLTLLGGWAIYGLTVFLAYRDYRFLTDAGMPKPFHWAFAFLSSYVYPIGRGVVTRRRTGRDRGVLAWSITSLVLSFVIAIVLMVVLMVQLITQITDQYGIVG